jgi:hypothetical protein
MTKFEVGDKFVPRKPQGGDYVYNWVPEMDVYDGEIMTVEILQSDRCLVSDGWVFHPDWCEKVEDNNTEFTVCENTGYHFVEPNKTIEWEQRRYEIAKELLAAQVVSTIWNYKDQVTDAIEAADELIKQLKNINDEN